MTTTRRTAGVQSALRCATYPLTVLCLDVERVHAGDRVRVLLIAPPVRVRRREARQSCQPGQRGVPACELGFACQTGQAREARRALQPAARARQAHALETGEKTGVVAYARHT